jgi:hypothetical protein
VVSCFDFSRNEDFEFTRNSHYVYCDLFWNSIFHSSDFYLYQSWIKERILTMLYRITISNTIASKLEVIRNSKKYEEIMSTDNFVFFTAFLKDGGKETLESVGATVIPACS